MVQECPPVEQLLKLMDGIEGTVNSIQLTQAEWAWKGGNVLLSASVAPTFTTNLRGPIAYVLAHRLLTKSRVEDAKAVLQQAQKNAVPKTRLHRLVQRDLALLTANKGVLRIRCPTRMTGKIEVVVDGQVINSVPVENDIEIELPVGKCVLKLDSGSGGKLSSTSFAVLPARYFVVVVE